MRRHQSEHAALRPAPAGQRHSGASECQGGEPGGPRLERALLAGHWDPSKISVGYTARAKKLRGHHKTSAREYIPCAGQRSHETHS